MMWRSKSYLLVKALRTVGVCLKALLNVLGAKLHFNFNCSFVFDCLKDSGEYYSCSERKKRKKICSTVKVL